MIFSYFCVSIFDIYKVIYICMIGFIIKFYKFVCKKKRVLNNIKINLIFFVFLYMYLVGLY